MKTIEYTFSRLCFKADVIESLDDNDVFIVHTPDGSFRMTKADFYRVFPNVPKTKSYQEGRIYHCKYPPQRAMQFLTDSISNHQREDKRLNMDLIGDEIREKIKEIGLLWHKSKHNPHIDEEIMNHWEGIIETWINDESMPLIVRKDTSKKGQAFRHPSGREIIISDSTFAIWIFGRVLSRDIYSLPKLRDMLSQNKIPMVFMQTEQVREKGEYTKPLGSFSLPEWKLCHIEPIGFNTNKSLEEIDINDIKEHFRKYASPRNMFVLPKEIGDLGEIPIFIEEQKYL